MNGQRHPFQSVGWSWYSVFEIVSVLSSMLNLCFSYAPLLVKKRDSQGPGSSRQAPPVSASPRALSRQVAAPVKRPSSNSLSWIFPLGFAAGFSGPGTGPECSETVSSICPVTAWRISDAGKKF